MSQLNRRKHEHIEAFDEDSGIERAKHYFDRIALIHRALPEIDYDAIDTSCQFMRRKLSLPFIISSMTGGDSQQLGALNRNLASAAEQEKVALGVGSQRIMINNEAAKRSFQLRALAPNIPIIANVGAVQMNCGVDADTIYKLVHDIEADALYLHLNPLQEAVQPEGNRNFSRLADQISRLRDALPVPIIVKEVGCGFSLPDMQRLQAAGIEWLDVAGAGGTSWSRVENHRRQDDLGLHFQDWGIPTPEVLYTASRHFPQLKLIASGGVRNGIDMVKAMVLGARLCAIASPLLRAARQDAQAVAAVIQALRAQFRTAMFLCGQDTTAALRNNLSLLRSKSQVLA